MPDSRAHAVTKVGLVAILSVVVALLAFPWWRELLNLDFHAWRALRLLALVPFLAGMAVGLRCIFDFAWTGHGTPAPIDPPRHLVVRGFYAYVRNPMYVGFAAAIFSAWILFAPGRWLALICAVAVFAGVHLFVRYYEEPTLRRKFGSDYEEYCRHVSRWRPRLSPWSPPRTQAARQGT